MANGKHLPRLLLLSKVPTPSSITQNDLQGVGGARVQTIDGQSFLSVPVPAPPTPTVWEKRSPLMQVPTYAGYVRTWPGCGTALFVFAIAS